MVDLIEELVEKWQDALDCAEDYAEQTLVAEFLDDLKTVLRSGK